MRYLQLDPLLSVDVMAFWWFPPSAVFSTHLWKRKRFEGVSSVRKSLFWWLSLEKDEVASACYVFHWVINFMDLSKNSLKFCCCQNVCWQIIYPSFQVHFCFYFYLVFYKEAVLCLRFPVVQLMKCFELRVI